MEATVLSVGKSVVDGALGYAQSAIAEEVALQLGVQRDQAFIRDELEMMQSFLMAAHDERSNNTVVNTWVKQVRDVAYDVEDCLQDFAVRLEKPSWWRIPRTLSDRRRVAKQMKELRAKVEDVSQRNVRYHLIKGCGSKPTSASELSSIARETMFGIEEARRQQGRPKVDLVRLIKEEDKNLKVIAVWGTGGVLGQTSVIKGAYENPEIKGRFECRAWVRVMHPFNPREFLFSMVRQFNTNSMEEQDGATVVVDVLVAMEKMGHADLAHEFSTYVNVKSCLIVLNGLSNIEDWDWIKTYFPNNKNGSRIIVSTEQGEIASICVGQESLVSELKQSSADQTIFAFYEKGSQDGQDSTKPGSSSNATTISTNSCTVSTSKILGDQSKSADGKNVVRKSLTRIRTMEAALEESKLIGREKEKNDIIKLISNQAGPQFQVISVWGMGGLGKTTLVKDIYQSQELSGTFEKRACVTVMRPFILEELLRSLVMQLDEEPSGKKDEELSGKKDEEPSGKKDIVSLLRSTKKTSPSTGLKELVKDLAKFLEKKRCLIVLDDLSSAAEWDLIIQSFPKMENASRIIVTTREESIAKHCSKKQEDIIYRLEGLEYEDAYGLFTKKVFKETRDLDEQYPEWADEAKPILKKCNGLPLAIVTIGGFLANQPKTVLVWRNLNKHISVELEMNPELETIRTVLIKSYDGLPYHLKSCFLYLSIFPEDYKVNRKRLVRRWTAEGYSREVRGKSAEEIADSYFMELISRSMILPVERSVEIGKGIDSCQVHDLIREIGISKSIEENLVFRLEEGCSLNTQGAIRHLAISSNWEGDQSEFESTVDMSRIRSLTVFAKWRPFFISEKMKLLRVLDLENASGLFDHHLEQIWKLLHLNYLSLRGRRDICHLPNSLGNLRQLQTLDIRDTQIIKLPKSIIELRKLQCLRAGWIPAVEDGIYKEIVESMPNLVRKRPCLLTIAPVLFCVACCAPQLLKLFSDDHGGDLNRRDVCNLFCCCLFPIIVMRLDAFGVAVPRGMRKLKALQTLGVVNIARGNAVVQDIKGLTRLRKLGVTGVNKKNGKELCSAIADLRRLESLSVRSEGEPGLHGCLDGMPSPPENLESLKLYGNLVKLPEWIAGLKNLVKLKLRSTRLSEPAAAMQVIGNLPNLAILRLLSESFQGDEVHFQSEGFRSLVMLELHELGDIKSVKFDKEAMPKLEQLQFRSCLVTNEIGFSGLEFLPSIKEVLLDEIDFESNAETWGERWKERKLKKDKLKEQLRAQLAENPNPKQPILKVE